MASLPFDIARCGGTAMPLCQQCRRREPGREFWQPYISPAIHMVNGDCSNFIEPPMPHWSNTTNHTPAPQGKD